MSNNDEYQVWLTTGDQTKLLERQSPIHATHAHYGFSVWVDRNKRRQVIDGFGAAITNSAAYVIFHSPQRHVVMQDLFGSGLDQLGEFVLMSKAIMLNFKTMHHNFKNKGIRNYWSQIMLGNS